MIVENQITPFCPYLFTVEDLFHQVAWLNVFFYSFVHEKSSDISFLLLFVFLCARIYRMHLVCLTFELSLVFYICWIQRYIEFIHSQSYTHTHIVPEAWTQFWLEHNFLYIAKPATDKITYLKSSTINSNTFIWHRQTHIHTQVKHAKTDCIASLLLYIDVVIEASFWSFT